MRLEPTGDRILIRPIKKTEEEKTEGGILVPTTVKKETAEGEVIAAGAGRYASESGVFMPNEIKVGDLVLYGAERGLAIEVDKDGGGKEVCLLMPEGDILGIIGRKEK